MGKPRCVNHGRAGDFKGGDSVQINETGKRLTKRVDVSKAGRPAQPTRPDLVHFQQPCVDSLKQQLACCKAAKVPGALANLDNDPKSNLGKPLHYADFVRGCSLADQTNILCWINYECVRWCYRTRKQAPN